MAGTITGGLKAAQTNKERHGDDFYAAIGSKGGSKPTTKPKGFAYARLNYTTDDPRHPRNAGLIGGKMSKRTAKVSE
jgi:general stress protein YciG